MNKEIEIKICLEDKEALQKKLLALSWKAVSTVFHKTYLVSTPNEGLFKKGIYPRVRIEGDKTRFTIKVKPVEQKGVDDREMKFFQREEHEIWVENAEELVKMLAILGLTEVLIDEKYRQTWESEEWANLSVVIDTLPFGCYMEIEGQKEEIDQMIKKLGLEDKERITIAYRRVYQDYCKKMGIKEEKNLVFKK